MNLEKTKDGIKKDEGLSLHTYKCTAGKLSIGWGRNLEDCGISKDEADYLLTNDIMHAVDFLSKFDFFKDLSDNRQYVLINMCFNIGNAGLLKFEKMIKNIKDNDFINASAEMRKSKWFWQVKYRAERLAKIMETDLWILEN